MTRDLEALAILAAILLLFGAIIVGTGCATRKNSDAWWIDREICGELETRGYGVASKCMVDFGWVRSGEEWKRK